MELKIKNKSGFSAQARTYVVGHVLYTSLHCSLWGKSLFSQPLNLDLLSSLFQLYPNPQPVPNLMEKW